jgi:hypothetical protein
MAEPASASMVSILRKRRKTAMRDPSEGKAQLTESVFGIVRQLNRLRLCLERHDNEHRSERFLPPDPEGICFNGVGTGDEGRRVEVTVE